MYIYIYVCKFVYYIYTIYVIYIYTVVFFVIGE